MTPRASWIGLVALACGALAGVAYAQENGAQTPENVAQALDALRSLPEIDGERVAVVAAAASAAAVLAQALDDDAPDALVALSAGKTEVAESFSAPALLIATTCDATGPTAVYADRIAESLNGPHEVLTLPGTESGLAILDAHWNIAREVILDWFDSYLSERGDG